MQLWETTAPAIKTAQPAGGPPPAAAAAAAAPPERSDVPGRWRRSQAPQVSLDSNEHRSI